MQSYNMEDEFFRNYSKNKNEADRFSAPFYSVVDWTNFAKNNIDLLIMCIKIGHFCEVKFTDL